MYPIVKKEKLADKIYLMMSRHRVLHSIANRDSLSLSRLMSRGAYSAHNLCYNREAGYDHDRISDGGSFHTAYGILGAGGCVRRFRGPLGCPSDLIDEDIEELKKKKIVFIAGGVGTAPVYRR